MKIVGVRVPPPAPIAAAPTSVPRGARAPPVTLGLSEDASHPDPRRRAQARVSDRAPGAGPFEPHGDAALRDAGQGTDQGLPPGQGADPTPEAPLRPADHGRRRPGGGRRGPQQDDRGERFARRRRAEVRRRRRRERSRARARGQGRPDLQGGTRGAAESRGRCARRHRDREARRRRAGGRGQPHRRAARQPEPHLRAQGRRRDGREGRQGDHRFHWQDRRRGVRGRLRRGASTWCSARTRSSQASRIRSSA